MHKGEKAMKTAVRSLAEKDLAVKVLSFVKKSVKTALSSLAA